MPVGAMSDLRVDAPEFLPRFDAEFGNVAFSDWKSDEALHLVLVYLSSEAKTPVIDLGDRRRGDDMDMSVGSRRMLADNCCAEALSERPCPEISCVMIVDASVYATCIPARKTLREANVPEGLRSPTPAPWNVVVDVQPEAFEDVDIAEGFEKNWR